MVQALCHHHCWFLELIEGSVSLFLYNGFVSIIRSAMSVLCERKDKLVLGVNLGIPACSSALYVYTVPWDFPSDAWQVTGMQ